MRCPHCGAYGEWVSGGKWKAKCGHEWTQWTCDY